jgi:hypothetical protein
MEQNWMEGWQRPGASGHFAYVMGLLERIGVVDAAGQPRANLRSLSDSQFEALAAA